MCSVCLPRLQQHCRDYCASRKRQKRKCVRFAKTIDVISLSAACSDGAEVIVIIIFINENHELRVCIYVHRFFYNIHLQHTIAHKGTHPCKFSRLKYQTFERLSIHDIIYVVFICRSLVN